MAAVNKAKRNRNGRLKRRIVFVKPASTKTIDSVVRELEEIAAKLPEAAEPYTKAVEESLPKILHQTANLSGKIGFESAAWRHLLAARAGFKSDNDLAQELGVDRSSVSRWKQGHPPQARNKEMLVNLDIVVSLLAGYLERETIPDWLRGLNPVLGNKRPIDVLRTGRLSEVVAAIEAERSGAYA